MGAAERWKLRVRFAPESGHDCQRRGYFTSESCRGSRWPACPLWVTGCRADQSRGARQLCPRKRTRKSPAGTLQAWF